LSAGCRGLDHEDIEALRSGVDGCCQAGGTRSHNNQVAHLRFIDGGVESQTISEFLIGRIAQDGATAANDNGNLRGSYFKPVEKLLGSIVGVEIHVPVGISIPAQEFAQSQCVGRVSGTEQDDVALALTDE